MAEFENKEELVTGFYDRGALRVDDFKFRLKSGRLSPIYYNQRPITSFKDGLIVNGREVPVKKQQRVCALAVSALSSGVDQLSRPHNHLHGIPQASTVIGGMVAQLRGESYIWQRVGDKKDYGIVVNYEADYNPDDKVGIIDDVVTDGASKITTLHDLKSEQLIPTGIVTMFDREEGGAEKLSDSGIEFRPIIGLSEAVAILRDEGRIGNQELDWVSRYHEGLRADGIKTTFSGNS